MMSLEASHLSKDMLGARVRVPAGAINLSFAFWHLSALYCIHESFAEFLRDLLLVEVWQFTSE
jgi:hypothetical protein